MNPKIIIRSETDTNVNSSIKMLPHTYNDIFDYGFNYRHIDPSKNTYNRTSIYLDAIPDKLVEGDETITITLEENPNYNIDPDFNSVTIIVQDGDIPDVQFTVPASEGKESVKRPNIEVSLSKPWNKNITVEYDYYTVLADDEDFNLKAGKVVIPAGRVKARIPLTVKNDKVAEVDEVVVVQLKDAKGANLYINEKHFYTIKNDDGEVKRNIINDKIYGVLLGSRGGSSLGAVVEMIGSEDQIQKLYGGGLTEFIPYVHNRHIRWAHPKGGTEDGIELTKLFYL